MHPEFENDVINFLNNFEGLVLGNETDVTNHHLYLLEHFESKYSDGEFEVDNKHFLLTDKEDDFSLLVNSIKRAIEEGTISSWIMDYFNEQKDLLNFKKQ